MGMHSTLYTVLSVQSIYIAMLCSTALHVSRGGLYVLTDMHTYGSRTIYIIIQHSIYGYI